MLTLSSALCSGNKALLNFEHIAFYCVSVCVQVMVSFTPHLVPMSRGILASMYVKLAPNATVESLREALEAAYKDEQFVHVLTG